MLPLLIRAALLPLWPVSPPHFQDEFSHLLAADTFASGRLTNPPHVMWQHFETETILQQPTYMSMYPPAQGMALTLGQVIAGVPWLGVWLSVGAMCAAITWMLQGWFPPRWALLGGLLTVIGQAGVSGYWMNSYWGGAVAATGGALVLGAYARLRRAPHVRDALILGVGLAVLANSRPYEGFVFSLPVICAFLVRMWRMRTSREKRWYAAQAMLTLVLVLSLTGAAMGYYFWRVTGSPWQMPEALNYKIYKVAPIFIFQKLRPEPVYHNAELRRAYVQWELPRYLTTRSWKGLATLEWDKLATLWWFYLGPALPIALLALPWIARDRRCRILLATALATLAAVAIEAWHQPHYLAPLTCVVYAIVLQCLRYIKQWRHRGNRLGRVLVPALVGLSFAVFVGNLRDDISHVPRNPTAYPWHWQRAAILDRLQRLPGQDLVIVRYEPEHNPIYEWVYNRADIDHAKVVWAQDMGNQNSELIHYFRGRRVWLLEPDAPGMARLSPYPATALGR